MKTKLNLLLTAVMLLLSANVFAQSGFVDPARGDVNKDGTVDVADVVAVIDIMKNGGGTATVGYFYLGTTKPTAENYNTLPGAVTTFASFNSAVGSAASVAAGQTLYLLCPAAWMEGKTPALEDKNGNAISFLEEKDEETISGYVIYKTQVWNAPNVVVLKTPYRKVIAHRGYWGGSVPENSRASLQRALALDIYGTEFDVHETKDGKIVVNHDAAFLGKSISTSTYEELCELSMSNGEKIPLLSDFLAIRRNTETSVKLIIELKNCSVEKVVNLVDEYQLQDQVEYISFSLALCQQLVALQYGSKTFYLNGNLTPTELKERGILGLDYHFSVLQTHPEWIKEALDNGMRVVVWTVDNKNMINEFVQQNVYVTTNHPEGSQ